MKFDLSSLPEGALDAAPKVGDVYPAQGGRPTAAWIVVGIGDHTAYLLGVDRDGNICSTQSYNFIALEDRPRIGFCKQIADLVLAVKNIDIRRSSRA